MVNPEGVEIAINGINAINNERLRAMFITFLKEIDYRLIKCNARGVDLNNNFDAKWGVCQSIKIPSVHGYPGGFVFSERESRALARLTLKIKPIFTISYHTKGEEIYFDFFQKGNTRELHRKIAKMVAQNNKYNI